jgi:SAM-dependent methyltransferase
MQDSNSSHYTFGDSDLAAARLERLASAYAPSSRQFLRKHLPEDVRVAVDLGCGPGYTTELLAALTRSQVIGYERSHAYVELARSLLPNLTFRELDVLRPPYPDRDLDVVYSRFLLTHLHEPEVVLKACLEHLRPKGRLLLEETALLTSTLGPLQRYYALVAELQSHYGQELTIGQRLEQLVRELPDATISYQIVPIELAASTMAQLHAMNIATWKRDPYMLSAHGPHELEALETELQGIAASGSSLATVTCEMAQVAIERA